MEGHKDDVVQANEPNEERLSDLGLFDVEKTERGPCQCL